MQRILLEVGLEFLRPEERLARVPLRAAYPEQAGFLFKKAHGVLQLNGTC